MSQADLVAITEAIGDLYRAAGFHLSRAIVPVQDTQHGRIRLQVIEGSITEVALKGEGAEQFGVRPPSKRSGLRPVISASSFI